MIEATTEQTIPDVAAKGRWALFDRADHVLLQVERISLGLAGAVILATFAVMVGAVFTRPWTGLLFSLGVEGAKMMLWPMGFLPAAYIWRRYGHVRFDLVLRAVSFRAAQRLELANSLVVLVLVVLMTWSAWHSFWHVYVSKTRTLTLYLPYWPLFWTSVAGAALLAVEVLFSALRHLREISKATGREQAPWNVPT